MSKLNLAAIVLGLFLLAACASQQPQPSYAEKLAQIPVPLTEEERQKSCAYIRSEIARMQNIAAVGSSQLPPMYALNIQISAQNNIASLESKAAEFRCTAAFAERQPPSSIEACVTTCKENTSRTSEQCFDACNK